ncbi:MAG: NADH:flavin oxidoreductase, partial [Planctomycetaceae bacterium]
LLHEFLSATSRPGEFGGGFEGRTRLLTTLIEQIQHACPDLMICVRLSLFDTLPYRTSRKVGEPMDAGGLLPYQLGFGTDEHDPLKYDLTEPFRLVERLQQLGVAALNVSCGSPYYNPHIQRPAIFPPSDGYQPPEDPLAGVVRQIQVARQCKAAFPDLPMVGSGYSYLQDYLPHVAQAVVRDGWIDSVGLGRMVLSCPEMPAETLRSGKISRTRVCRTFSDCTTGPRNGLVSGCFPLDPYYRQLPEAARMRGLKQSVKDG